MLQCVAACHAQECITDMSETCSSSRGGARVAVEKRSPMRLWRMEILKNGLYSDVKEDFHFHITVELIIENSQIFVLQCVAVKYEL